VPHPVFDELRRTVEALVADDPAAALAALRPVARALAAERGAEFRALVARIPEAAWHHDVEVASAMGVSFRAAGSPRGSSAIGYFDAAEAELAAAGRDADPGRVAVWLGSAAALRTLGRLDAARHQVERARDLDGPGSILPISTRVELDARGRLEAGMLDLHFGNLDAARAHLEFAHGLATDHLTRAEHIECLGGLALVEYVRSGLDPASRYSAEARDLAAGSTLWLTGYAAPALVAETLIAVERDDLDVAAAIEPEMLEAASRTDWEPFSQIAASYHRLAGGRLAEGLDFLDRAREGYRAWAPAGLGASVESLFRASVLMYLDHGQAAWELLRALPPYEHHILCPARLIAQLRLRHGDLHGAAEALEGCEQIAGDHSSRTMVEVRMLRAAIEFERGETVLSDVMFDHALVAIARTGSRSAVRLVPPGTLAALTARALMRDQGADATAMLRRIADETEGQGRLIEPLTGRELLVLAEVEKGATVAGIAAALYLSPNTVKTHLRNLYRKLGVTTRADAIRKAKSLGLGHSVTRDSPE
jgi:LuxR family maltose regulon positive regulatory protein